MPTTIKKSTVIGPGMHGRKMTLKKFEFAQVEEGCYCELARGYIVVSEVANYYHAMQVMGIKTALILYHVLHKKVIHAVFENGVFRPTEPVDLPERCEVVFEPRRG